VRPKIIFGNWSEAEIEKLVADAAKIKNTGRRVALLSEQFLGNPYKESTLMGSATIPERLVINLAAFDCFTFLDCIEAMRLSRSFADFEKNFIRVRYKKSAVEYKMRNHFFTDWSVYNKDFLADKTREVGGKKTMTAPKVLNKKGNGTPFLAGIKPFKRKISYIPSGSINKTLCLRLRTGDYIGMYTDICGLDVSHVGIIVKAGSVVYLRHASSVKGKVVDEDFSEYVTDKYGIIILRPR